jgi:hypothetical protein
LVFFCTQGEKSNDILRFLTFRLDFNDFHANHLSGTSSGGMNGGAGETDLISPLRNEDFDDFLSRANMK